MGLWSMFLTVCASQLDEDDTLLQARLARNHKDSIVDDIVSEIDGGFSVTDMDFYDTHQPIVFQCVEKGASTDVFWQGDVRRLQHCQAQCNKRRKICKAFSYREGGAHPNNKCYLHKSGVRFDAREHTQDDPWYFYHTQCADGGGEGGDGGGNPPPTPPTKPPPGVFQCVEKAFGTSEPIWHGEGGRLEECQEKCIEHEHPNCSAFSYRESGAYPQPMCVLHQSADGFDVSAHTQSDPWKFYHGCEGGGEGGDNGGGTTPPRPPTPPGPNGGGTTPPRPPTPGGDNGGGNTPPRPPRPTPPTPPPPGAFQCVEKAFGNTEPIGRNSEVGRLEECQEKCDKHEHPRCSAFSYLEGGAQTKRICVLHQSADGFDASAHTQDYPWKFYHGCKGGGERVEDKWDTRMCQDAAGACHMDHVFNNCMKTCGPAARPVARR